MSTGKGFVQVPPQSTGKKIATEERTEIFYDNATDEFKVGDIVTGVTSGASGRVVAVDTTGYLPNEGALILEDATGQVFQDNENLQVSAVTIAVAKLSGNGFDQNDYDIQKFILTDAQNINRNQVVNRFGAASVTFQNGSPEFGPFGTLVSGEPRNAKFFSFQYDNAASDFSDVVVGGGSTSHELTGARTLLSTGTASGDRITRTSHYYNPYYPGVGNDGIFTIQLGDTGKANVRRRWGLFDDDNGFFFELDGTTLYTVIRSNTSGSPVDTRVAQEDWTIDRLDGTDALNYNLDVSKGNAYWIDLQWLGTGRVRFGVYEPGGERITAHTFENANIGNIPYTRTATLPVRLEQENTGTAGSSSEMRSSCAVVRHLSNIVEDGKNYSTEIGPITVTTASGESPLVAMRPAQTFNGVTNRSIWKGRAISGINTGNEPVKLKIRAGIAANLPGSSFVQQAGTSTEIDSSATSIITAGTAELGTAYVKAGETFFLSNPSTQDVEHDWENYLFADGTTQPCFILTGETLSGTNTTVYVSASWTETRV